MSTSGPARGPARALACALASLGALAVCSNPVDVPSDQAPFALRSFFPGTVLPGTRLSIRGEGFRGGGAEVSLQGDLRRADGSSARLDWTGSGSVDSSTEVTVSVDESLVEVAAGGGTLHGDLFVAQVVDGRKVSARMTVALGVAAELTPKLTSFGQPGSSGPPVVFFGDELVVAGSGFLLGGGEGRFEVLATGSFARDGGGTQTLNGYPLLLRVADRDRALYVHSSEMFGLRTGTFTGSLLARNTHKDGTVRESAPLQGQVIVLPSQIAAVSPKSASRGQKVSVTGHGFFESRVDGTAASLRLDGTFTPTGRPGAALKLDQELEVDGAGNAVWVLRPQKTEDEGLTGPGADPGIFQGKIYPVLSNGRDELVGAPWTGTFTVLPTRQVVHLRFVPGFTEALSHFGLRNLDHRLREHIVGVCQRDYASVAVEFRLEPPDDFAEWTTVELTGDDPNQADLFGLDNTAGKDSGNVRLDDYVGGRAAEQEAMGSFAYGGVFLTSFLRFSPNVCRVQNAEGLREFKACPGRSSFPMATERFDAIFKAFAPILGGTEATADEWAAGPRSAAAQEAVRVLGNLAGNTVVHELGHSLGLAQETGVDDEYHNPGDTPGWIMNPGGARPFEERAELDELPPEVWSPGDAEYLGQVLPGG